MSTTPGEATMFPERKADDAPSDGSLLSSAPNAERGPLSDTTSTGTRSTTTRPTSPSSAGPVTWPPIGGPKPYYVDDLTVIYHGDCREVIGSLDFDVIVTDPPYGMRYDSGWSGATVRGDNDTTVRDAVLDLWDGPALVFGRWSVPRPSRTRHVLIWDKGDWPGMGDLQLPWGPSTEEIYVLGSDFVGRRRGSIIRDANRPTGTTSRHPSEKPVALMFRLLEACRPDWRICDPFAGSGSTLYAAKRMGRTAIGIEIEERYCEIAATRCSQEVLGLVG